MQVLALFLYVLAGAGLLLHGILAWSTTAAGFRYVGSAYWLTVPHLLLLFTTILLLVRDAVRGTRATLVAAAIGLALLVPTWLPGLGAQRGGEDFEGFAWAVVVGAASFLNTALGLPLAIVAHRMRAGSSAVRQPGHCSCGYDLTGNVSGRCPECGIPARTDSHTPEC